MTATQAVEGQPAGQESPVFVDGEPFNPWRGSCGFFVPDVVQSRFKLTQGQKSLYLRLVRYAGRNGVCFPSQEKLAADQGRGERTVRRDLDRLEEVGLIRRRLVSEGRGRGVKTYFDFLFHPEFRHAFPRPVSSGQSDYIRPKEDVSSGQNVQYIRPESTDTSGQNRPIHPARTCSAIRKNTSTENTVQRISSSLSPESDVGVSAATTPTSLPAGHEIHEAEFVDPQAVEAGSQKTTWNPTDAEFGTVRELLRQHRHVPELPDAKITTDVLRSGGFYSAEDFALWISVVATPHKGIKSFAFYAADAKHWDLARRENARSKAEAEAFAREEQARLQVAQAEEERRRAERFAAHCGVCVGTGIVERNGNFRFCFCQYGKKLREERGDSYLDELREQKNAESELEAARKRQSEEWNKLYPRLRAAERHQDLRFKEIEFKFVWSDDVAERDELLERAKEFEGLTRKAAVA